MIFQALWNFNEIIIIISYLASKYHYHHENNYKIDYLHYYHYLHIKGKSNVRIQY